MSKKLKEILSTSLYLLVVLALTFLIVTYVGQRTKVIGSSMEPMLEDGDNLIVDKISYRFEKTPPGMISYSPEATAIFNCFLSFPHGINSKRTVQPSSATVSSSSAAYNSSMPDSGSFPITIIRRFAASGISCGSSGFPIYPQLTKKHVITKPAAKTAGLNIFLFIALLPLPIFPIYHLWIGIFIMMHVPIPGELSI